MRTIVERAVQADIPDLVELMSQFYAESNYTLDREWAAGSFAQLLRDETRGAVWIARRGIEIAGHVVLVLRHSMEFGGPAGVVDDLFVLPQFRRQGVGSALLSALFDACRKLHVAALLVEVGTDNVAATAFYGTFGLCDRGTDRQTLIVQLMETVTLFRPVGPKELALIEQSGWTAFPPRLPEQPIFYPVLNEQYAVQIARDWNVKSDGAGFVTKFQVNASFASRYPVQVVGSAMHQELWVPAEDLAQFNQAIVGRIEVVAQFRKASDSG